MDTNHSHLYHLLHKTINKHSPVTRYRVQLFTHICNTPAEQASSHKHRHKFYPKTPTLGGANKANKETQDTPYKKKPPTRPHYPGRKTRTQHHTWDEKHGDKAKDPPTRDQLGGIG